MQIVPREFRARLHFILNRVFVLLQLVILFLVYAILLVPLVLFRLLLNPAVVRPPTRRRTPYLSLLLSDKRIITR